MSLIEAISPTARALFTAEKQYLARLRELDSRLTACQSTEAEEQVAQLIEAENRRWKTLQQADDRQQ